MLVVCDILIKFSVFSEIQCILVFLLSDPVDHGSWDYVVGS